MLLAPLLPRRGLGLAPLLAAAGRRWATQAKPRPGRSGALTRERRRAQAAVGGAAAAAALAGSRAAFSLFSQEAEEATEEDAEKGESKETEDAIIFLLKKAKMANLAFLRGQLEEAEKLFKAAMSFLLAGDMKQDDNAIIEMSLKLASIYAAQDQDKLALAGYEFCILTLEEKIDKQQDMPTEEERANTRLLLGLSLDSYARYLLAHSQAALAQKMYERALQISVEVQGEKHPQTVVLMNDLATALDAQGHYDDAYAHVSRASELARQTEHPEAHVVLNNLAGILMHKEDFSQAKEVYKEALKRAEESGDGASVRHIREELAELAKRRRRSQVAGGEER
ncbi:tetratricopeptide repeat protein 19, mitochondrial isoform X3 [Hemicordylus capensis]|uniref:tetratricopeptide repeat protein 19, mitochondrial isoform X3 n=1 Tax=Hemicordylus capensis TaxID=884348 RepID=UPI002303FB63|nr:tetratricopeptide repeat protein 19, mitochondrial isoform X3 [Hemicordylus capensis]